jgi:FKBP-type peptidyl-prolyl cis-trans isomerase
MKNKKDAKMFIGLSVILIIGVLAILGYKEFGKSVAVPQVTSYGIEQSSIEVLTTASELLKNKETQKMEPIQVIKRDSGLVIEIQQAGTGSVQVKSGDTVSVDYRGMFTDGKVFDESYKLGQKFSFTPGAGQVIAGWEEGVLGMKVGEKRRITVPSSLGYGPNDYGPIPGGSTLIFDIELHKIN